MVELLSPVGNFECLKAAVQNGADAVYFGASSFSARAFAENFSLKELEEAISYAKLRGVRCFLTLNTLMKEDELPDAFALAKNAYEFGIDAIIVQDLGLARLLIRSFPDLPIHASTQMSIHNLRGVQRLEAMGFRRVVLSRELSVPEIEYICQNSHVDIECFIHGALCISYSGQCLLSSMVGGRSGNRGRCAQPCRLPYELLEDGKKVIDHGHLLSPRDLCGLDFVSDLIQAGVTSFKIEGRMKSAEYVATVTRIYRKYIDLALAGKPEPVTKQDKEELMQVFNRGGFSSGHLAKGANRDLVFPEKPNNRGLFLGIVQKYQENKGYITLKLNEPLAIGDTIALESEQGTYTVSELMENRQNQKEVASSHLVTIGRMKGNIYSGDKVYKMSSRLLSHLAKVSYQKEYRKIPLEALVTIEKDQPISIEVRYPNFHEHSRYHDFLYHGLCLTCQLDDVIPVEAKNKPLTADTIILQIMKTNQTPYEFQSVRVQLGDNLFLPKISSLNQLRRLALEAVQEYAYQRMKREANSSTCSVYQAREKQELEDKLELELELDLGQEKERQKETISSVDLSSSPIRPTISLLFNLLSPTLEVEKLPSVDSVYVPLKYFTDKAYESVITALSKRFSLYLYMPTIVRSNYGNLFSAHAKKALDQYHLKGFVISNICNIELLNHTFVEESERDFELITNYTFNVYNSQTILALRDLGITRFTLSPELDESGMKLSTTHCLPKELIVYGKLPLMNMHYCLLGKTNQCYPTCQMRCQNGHVYSLRDRLHAEFRFVPDHIQTVTTLFNSKTLSLSPERFCIDSARIDILDESIDEINEIVQAVREGKRIEGKDYTNGNLNRQI